MPHFFRQPLIKFALLPLLAIALLLTLRATVFGSDTVAVSPWQLANQVAPTGLMAQVGRENLQPGAAIDLGRMKVWKLQQSQQPQPLYLIDTRIMNEAAQPNANPLCGALGCAFLGYLPTHGNQYQRVLNLYLNPLLPPDVPLLQPMPKLQSGLPCLLVHQLEHQQLRLFKLCWNGRIYEVVDSSLLPKVYE